MTTQSENKKFQVRPRFQIESPKTVVELDEILKSHINNPNAPFDGKVTEGFVSLYPHDKDHHYWSPHLSVIIEDAVDGSSLRGHYGPSPSVWTMFVFLYAVIGLSAVVLTVIGFANRSIGLSSAILWTVPFLLLAFFTLYYVSYIGQKKGHDQIEAIHHFFEDCIKQKIQ